MSEDITVDRALLERIRRVLVGTDSYLSYLRHRAEHSIPWGSVAMSMTQAQCDQRIGEAREAERLLEDLLGPQRPGEALT